MAKRVTYEPCPKCREIGRDNAGDNLVVYPDSGGHCFACGFHRYPSRNLNPYLESSVKEVNATAVLPTDFSREVPNHAWQWLLQYGLGYKYWQPHVGWSEKDSRLVFTVGNPAEFSIGRFIAKPNSGTESKRKWFVWGESHKTPHIFGDYSKSKEIVLVEDLISAHKVGQVTACIPLFGTKVFDSVYPALRHIKLPIVIWLDKDQEQTFPKKAAHLRLLTGLNTRYISTNEDPKCLGFDKINSLLENR